ncbi:uncharacterized protein TNCV_4558191 [Trichonephila clavipes]|nr:uncharacterized protein TNCV_4558191 [Trichonephila clavipes]
MVEPWRSLTQQDWIHLYWGTLHQRFLSSVSCDSRLEKHQPILINSRDPAEFKKERAHAPETFPLSNMSHLAFFAHANVFHHSGQPVPIELSIASIPEDGKDPEEICITVDHSNLLTTAKDSRANRYISERLILKSHLLGSMPLEYLSFYVRAIFVTWLKETEASWSSRARNSVKCLKSCGFLPSTWKYCLISGI